MKFLNILTTSAVALMAVSSASAFAAEPITKHAPHLKAQHHKAQKLSPNDKVELQEYIEYEKREPCQFYQPIPEGFVKDGCHLKPIEKKKPVKKMAIIEVINDYELHFAYDSAQLEPAAKRILDMIARDINTYKPGEVTVAGYTDTAGDEDYNIKLSERRAQAVSDALTQYGIPNRVLQKKAYGEKHNAVKTNDGVALKENRRVVVEFRK